MTLSKLREAKRMLSTIAVVAAETGHNDLAERFWQAYDALHNALVPLERMIAEKFLRKV